MDIGNLKGQTFENEVRISTMHHFSFVTDIGGSTFLNFPSRQTLANTAPKRSRTLCGRRPLVRFTPSRCSLQPGHRLLPPVLTPRRSDAFSEAALSSPVVHRYVTDDGEHYAMWYTMRPVDWEHASRAPKGMLSGVISLAVSHDGLTWRRVEGPFSNQAILGANDEQWWAFDTAHLSLGSVLFTASDFVRADGGIYLLYYAAGGDDPLSFQGASIPGGITRIGLAISKDGEHFTRFEGEFPSGAVLDVASKHKHAFDDAFISSPSVLYDNSRKQYMMYYHGASFSSPKFAIGLATSKDGFSFRRSSTTPIVTGDLSPEGATWASNGVCRPCVIHTKTGTWAMFMEVIGLDGIHRIALSESNDGITWGTLSLVLDIGLKHQWDAHGVSHPCAVMLDDGGIRLYYTGKSDNHDVNAGRGTSIGVASSNGDNWYSFSRESESLRA